jgi:signal transduction histidine kinase
LLTFLRCITNNQKVRCQVPLCAFIIAYIISLPFSSCIQKSSTVIADIKKQLQVADSIGVSGHDDTVIKLLFAIRDKYPNYPNPAMAAYYRIKSMQSRDDELMMNAWADSAIAEFSDNTIINLYPHEYFKSLISKGVACIVNKKLNLGLQYFFKAKEVDNITDCDRADLLSMIAGIYYDQQNYRLAAQTWYASYTMAGGCGITNPQKIFLQKQGFLDNAGLAYNRAGYLDSAGYCYFKDIKLVDSEYAGRVSESLLAPARMVVYDNLGGLQIEKGNFDSAEYYLTRSVEGSRLDVDGTSIPPMLKLADLYTKTGDNRKAAAAFAQSKALIEKFKKHNGESQIKWHKLYAAYLFKNKRQAEAYFELDEYIRLRDSLDKATTAIMTLNVGREFNTIQQQHTMEELKIKDELNQIYLWAITIVIFLSVIIIILAYRNLYKSRKSHSDTIKHNAELQKTLEQLEAANKNYIRIMRVMAHDLRNPLGGITGIAAMLLKDEVLSAEARHMLQLVESTGNHTMEMINELLRSGLAAENEPMAVEKLDVAGLLQNTVELLLFKAKEKQQQLLFENDNGPVFANINHEKMWRVFNNIVVNAIKFTHAGGVIIVLIKQQGNHIIIAIEDNGIGIPQGNKDEIFDMFTAAKRLGTGGEKPFGLGLSISKSIVERHDGKIWFESTEGKGTTFFIQLPVAR